MADILQIENFPQINREEKSELTADVALGATSISVINGQGYDTNHVVLIGNVGSDKSEIKTPSNVSVNILTIPATSLTHSQGDPVYKLRGNKVRVYRAVAPSSNLKPVLSDFSLLTTLTLEADQLYTEYTDATGGSGYWYLFTYYNDIPTTPEETAKDLSAAIRGGGYGHYATIKEVRKEAGFQNADFIGDDIITDARDDGEDIVKGKLSDKYDLPFSSVPRILIRITRLIAGGLLLLEDYGVGSSGTNKEGKQKYDLGMDLLKQVVEGTIPLLDTDESKIEEQVGIDGYPDGTNSDHDAIFCIDDIY